MKILISFMLLCIYYGCNNKEFSIKDEELIDRLQPSAEGFIEIKPTIEGGLKTKCNFTGVNVFDLSLGIATGRASIMVDGLKHIWIGRCRYGRYIFDSNPNDPLTFKVDKELGYTYLNGSGKIIFPNGHIESFPE